MRSSGQIALTGGISDQLTSANHLKRHCEEKVEVSVDQTQSFPKPTHAAAGTNLTRQCIAVFDARDAAVPCTPAISRRAVLLLAAVVDACSATWDPDRCESESVYAGKGLFY